MTLDSPQDLQGRTSESGPGGLWRSRYSPWLLLALAALLLSGLFLGTRSGGSAASGGYPSFLPKATVDGSALHTIVDASVASPALASQGDTVRVHTDSGSVLATVVGPEVPNEGLPYQSPDSPATWTITLAGVTGQVPVNVSQFSSSDDLGKIYHPTLVMNGPALPAAVTAGQKLSFKITTTMRTGEGLLRWSPVAGPKFPVAWDFVVEDD